MKKHKLIKSLLFTPLATIPLVAAVGCGSNDGGPKIDEHNLSTWTNKKDDIIKEVLNSLKPERETKWNGFLILTGKRDFEAACYAALNKVIGNLPFTDKNIEISYPVEPDGSDTLGDIMKNGLSVSFKGTSGNNGSILIKFQGTI